MLQIFSLVITALVLSGCCSGGWIKQPGNTVQISHTQCSNHGMACITSIEI